MTPHPCPLPQGEREYSVVLLRVLLHSAIACSSYRSSITIFVPSGGNVNLASSQVGGAVLRSRVVRDAPRLGRVADYGRVQPAVAVAVLIHADCVISRLEVRKRKAQRLCARRYREPVDRRAGKLIFAGEHPGADLSARRDHRPHLDVQREVLRAIEDRRVDFASARPDAAHFHFEVRGAGRTCCRCQPTGRASTGRDTHAMSVADAGFGLSVAACMCVVGIGADTSGL